MIRRITPPTIAPPAAAYAHAMLVVKAYATLYTSGVVPTAPDGSVPDGIASQARQVWVNIEAILAEADMTAANIVSVTTYAVVGHPLADVMAARDQALQGHLAASTLIPVVALARPEWLVEIAVVAAK